MPNDRRIKNVQFASECCFSNERDYTMIHDQLGMSKVSVRWAPRNPNIQNRQQRMESRQEILEVYNVNPEDSYSSCNRRLTHLHYRPFICPCRIRVENALKTHVKRISFPTRISKIQSKPTIDTR